MKRVDSDITSFGSMEGCLGRAGETGSTAASSKKPAVVSANCALNSVSAECTTCGATPYAGVSVTDGTSAEEVACRAGVDVTGLIFCCDDAEAAVAYGS